MLVYDQEEFAAGNLQNLILDRLQDLETGCGDEKLSKRSECGEDWDAEQEAERKE